MLVGVDRVQMNLTDEQWAAWTDKRPHFKPRRAGWMAVMCGGGTLLNVGSVAALLLASDWPTVQPVTWFLIALNGVLALANGVATLRYVGAWRAAKIRESCPVPPEVAYFLLATRVDHYLQLQAQRRAAWSSLRRQVVGR